MVELLTGVPPDAAVGCLRNESTTRRRTLRRWSTRWPNGPPRVGLFVDWVAADVRDREAFRTDVPVIVRARSCGWLVSGAVSSCVSLDDDGERRGLLSGVWDAEFAVRAGGTGSACSVRAGVAGCGVLTWRFDWNVMARCRCGAIVLPKLGK